MQGFWLCSAHSTEGRGGCPARRDWHCGRVRRKLHQWLLCLGLAEHIINAITGGCWAEGSREGASQQPPPSPLMLILIASRARALLESQTHFKVTPTTCTIMRSSEILWGSLWAQWWGVPGWGCSCPALWARAVDELTQGTSQGTGRNPPLPAPAAQTPPGHCCQSMQDMVS